MSAPKKQVAYFSMEFAFDTRIPNYAGGLGVLAADAMYSCADLEVDAVGVTLLYHTDSDPEKAFDPAPHMQLLEERTSIEIEDRTVHIAIWKMVIPGKSGHSLPVYFLSTNVPENTTWDRDITKNLYSGDGYTRLSQEAVLGIGGFNALKVLGHTNVGTYHMNEGHAAFLTLASLKKHAYETDKVRERCTFTTHTPVAAGHDYFDYTLAQKALGEMLPLNIREFATHDNLSMTHLGLALSRKVNSVSEKHRHVCENMFPGTFFENVTNGIYHPRWVGAHMKEVFDYFLPDWEKKPEILSQVFDAIPDDDIRKARRKEKQDFIAWINSQPNLFPFEKLESDDYFDEEVLTIGFARRFVPYKRPDLIFQNIDTLRKIGYRKLQFVFACRCHPSDAYCNNLKESLEHYAQELRGQVRLITLPDYNIDVAKRLITGVDIWLNNPIATREASGTSGMKAALNGIMNLSTYDGWWIEGFDRNQAAGWAFGGDLHANGVEGTDQEDSQALLDNLADAVRCYHECDAEWINRVKSSISLAAYFNTHRMITEYQDNMWQTHSSDLSDETT